MIGNAGINNIFAKLTGLTSLDVKVSEFFCCNERNSQTASSFSRILDFQTKGWQ